jgi:hypothetical protein
MKGRWVVEARDGQRAQAGWMQQRAQLGDVFA